MNQRTHRPPSLCEVAEFWESAACGERYGERQDEIRYELEPEIPTFASFRAAKGMRLLEIGIGMGSDYIRWLRAGAIATGVDLTSRALRLTSIRAASEGLQPRLSLADAEHLPFPDASFDMVYSWGVLHHSPNPPRAIAEAQRVLAPGGQLKLMLYHRHSYVAVAAWGRFGLLRGRPFTGLRRAVSQVESPGTQAYTRDELGALLTELGNIAIVPRLTSWDRRWMPGIASLLGDRFGWFLLATGTKR